MTFVPEETNNGHYATLLDIEWNEYLGELDEEGEQVEENAVIPNAIEGYLNEGEFSIQNYGNSMNYFVVLGECNLKYMHLKKVID